MRKKVLSILLAVSMVAVMAGCSNEQSSAGDDQSNTTQSPEETSPDAALEEDASEKTEAQVVTMMGWYGEDAMSGAIALVNEQLAGEYVLEYTFVALSDYNNVLGTQLASGEGPDIVVGGADFPSRIKAGNVIDISDREYVKDFNEAGFALCSMDNKIYGIPMYAWYNGIWYNEDILEECGVELPKTFDEYIAACEKIQAAGYQPMIYGLADSNTAYCSLVGYLENNFYNNNQDNTDGVGFDTKFAAGDVTLDGNINDCVKKWYTLIEKGFINVEMLGISEQEAVNKFAAGEAAFFDSGPWYYDTIKAGGINFGFMPLLSESGSNVFTGGGPAASLGINVNSANKEGAEKVLEAFASVEVQQAIADSNPGSPSYRSGVTVEIPEEYEAIVDCVNAGNIAVNWDRWSVNMPAQTVQDEGIALMQGMVSGELTPDEFVQGMDAKADSVRYE